MFESAEIGHAIDKETYEAAVPALREALLEAQFELQQQARSLNELQTACTRALASCETLCGELQRSFETLQSGVEHSNRITGAALGNLSSSVNDLNEALDALQRAQR